MPKVRSHGDGGLYWSGSRNRWVAELTVGHTSAGKRIVRRGTGKTKAAAKAKLRELLRDHEDGLAVSRSSYTVADAVNDWLRYGLAGRSESTVQKCRDLAKEHITPQLGTRQLRELTADDVDRWLADRAQRLATRSLREVRSVLKRAITRAQARDKVRRNVVLLCEVPTGQRPGRPSKSLTLDQAQAVVTSAEGTALYAYVVLSILIGMRTEELRALTWDRVDLLGQPGATPPVPPAVMVWRSVRFGGDTKTKKSRRTLRLPQLCVQALLWQRERQQAMRAGARHWTPSDLVFTSRTGTPLDASHVRRNFRSIVKAAGLDAAQWTPRELRHSFVSLLSGADVPIEKISRLVGHSDSTVTETVYRHELRPMLTEGAEAMDDIFRATG